MTVRGNRKKSEFVWSTPFAISVILIVILVGFGVYISDPSMSKPEWVKTLTDGFNGSIFTNVFTSVIFLLLSMHLSAGTERSVETSRAILEEQKSQEERRKKIAQFHHFIEQETYHEIYFPDLSKNPFATYLVEPHRDQNGKPVKRENEMTEFYIIKVRAPAHEEVQTPERLKNYESWPIRTNEYYFCQFFDGDWHMGQRSDTHEWLRFQFWGKSSISAEHVVSANEHVGAQANAGGFKTVASFFVSREGKIVTPDKGSEWHLLTDANGGPWLKADTSPLKQVYSTNGKSQDSNHYMLVIEDIWGYFEAGGADTFRGEIERKCLALNVTVPQVPRWRFGH